MKDVSVIVSIALLIGGVIGWASGGNKDSMRSVVREKSGRDDRATHPKWTKEDFIRDAQKRAQAIKQPDFNPLADELKDWSDEEIQAALDESLTDPECALSFGSGSGLASLLLREWMRRDFGSALAWFNGVEPRAAQARMAGVLSYNWPADRAREGMDFAIKNRDLLLRFSPWSILGKNVEASAKEGPAAVEEFLQFARDNGFSFKFGNAIQFPEGFDFAALAGGASLKAMLDYDAGDSIIKAWQKQNPDEVFDWMLEERGAKSLTMLASDPSTGSWDAMKWMGGRFRTEFGAGAITAFAHPAIQGATGRGAEELIQLKESYGDLLDGAGFPQGTYSEDFDFHRFVTSGMTSGMEAIEPFQYWSAKDKEAAWAGFKEVLEKDRSISVMYFGSVFTGVAAVEGEAKAAEWMMSKLDEIPADARKSALSSLQQGGALTGQGVESVMAALPNAADRATFAGSLISPNQVNPLGTIALEKLPVEERLQAVVNAATSNQGWARGDTPEAKKARANLDAVAERAGLSVEQRAQVSAILAPGEN